MSITTTTPPLLIVDPAGIARSRTAAKILDELIVPKTVVENLNQARTFVSANKPGVILLVLDKSMRDIPAICANLHSQNAPHLPAIVIVGEKTLAEPVHVTGGIKAIFTPPYNWQVITETLQQLLDSIAATREQMLLNQLLELGRIATVSIDTAHQRCRIDSISATLLNLVTSEREALKWDDSVSRDWQMLFSRCDAHDQQRLADTISDALQSGAGFELEFELGADRHHKRRLRITGHAVHADENISAGCTHLLIQDVTPQTARANSDAVNRLLDTTLGLRRGDRVLHSLLQVISASQCGTLLLIRLHGIANFHRRHGYEQSGRLLHQFTANLEAQLRKLATAHNFSSNGQQMLARLPGGEFIVVFPNTAHDSELAPLLKHALASATAALTADDQLSLIDLRFGIASWPRDGGNPDEILQAGTLASNYFEPSGTITEAHSMMSMLVRAREQARLELEMQYAVERGQLQLHYQPKLTMHDGVLSSFEALLRWQRGKNLLIPPAIFVPIAERTGLITQLGSWVIEAAAAQIAQWRSEGAGNVPVAVNVSPQQFIDGKLVELLKSACRRHMIEPHFLQLEVTESCLIDDADATTLQLQAIRQLGHPIALDDFGTGYSSLSYLRQLPLSILKIDRSFITGIDPAAGARNLAFNIIGIGKSLGLKIVAEGVSAAMHWDILKQWKCEEAQGYLISQPVTANNAIELWRRGQWQERSHAFTVPTYASGS